MMKAKLNEIKESLLTGVSYMLPFVISGGVLIAIGFLLGGYQIANDPQGSSLASTVFWLGKATFGLMVPVLGAFVAYSIADKPGIAVGMVGAWMATDPWGLGQSSGFLGGLVAGIIAGYMTNGLKRIPLPASLRSLLPTLIVPLVGVGIVGLLVFYVIGGPIAWVTASLTGLLNSMGTGNLLILGIIQGCMLAFDMGGPCNKVAYAAAHPLQVIPSLMVGSAVGCALSYVFGLTMQAPHGGLFVFFALNNVALFLAALAVGGTATATALIALKRPVKA